jgi:hypothetical protein
MEYTTKGAVYNGEDIRTDAIRGIEKLEHRSTMYLVLGEYPSTGNTQNDDLTMKRLGIIFSRIHPNGWNYNIKNILLENDDSIQRQVENNPDLRILLCYGKSTNSRRRSKKIREILQQSCPNRIYTLRDPSHPRWGTECKPTRMSYQTQVVQAHIRDGHCVED